MVRDVRECGLAHWRAVGTATRTVSGLRIGGRPST